MQASSGMRPSAKLQHWTKLILRSTNLQITFIIKSMMSKKARRQLALEIFRAVKPVLRGVFTAYLFHANHKPLGIRDSTGRAASASLKARPGTPSPMGLRFRLRRLELGLTLRQLAQKTKIDYSQLSLIERGLSRPRLQTRLKLERALFQNAH